MDPKAHDFTEAGAEVYAKTWKRVEIEADP
jgi:hypothetical protein